MIRAGAYAEQAARAAGIVPSTYYSWMERGESGERPFSEFSEPLKTADAQAEQQRVEHIQNAADNGTWQAAAWWLERRFPGRWGQPPPAAWTPTSSMTAWAGRTTRRPTRTCAY